MAIDDFLNHRTGGSRGGYMKSWKKDGRVNTWMHTARLPMAVWKHTGFPRIVLLEDRQANEQVARVWSGDYVCHEREDVLRAQYDLTPKGEREDPPLYCPLCRLVDCVRRLVASGRLPWHKALFKFTGDVEKETLTLHAGGLFMTRKMVDDLDEEEVRDAKKQGLVVKEMWKESGYAKAEYLFCVVDDAHPEAGLQKTFERPSLGDAVKDVIAKERESEGAEDGDPTVNPYAIQWQYRKDEEPKKMYAALRMRRLELTPAIEALITGPAPDIRSDIKPFNVVEMRAFLEQHALVKLPWDEIFKVEEREEEEESEPPSERRPAAPTAKRAASKPRREEPEELEEPEPSRSVKAKPAKPEAPKGPKKRGAPKREPIPDDDDPKAVACEQCGKAMWDDAHECPHEGCGAQYDAQFKLIADEEPKKAPPRRRAAPPPEPSRPAPGPGEEVVDDLPF